MNKEEQVTEILYEFFPEVLVDRGVSYYLEKHRYFHTVEHLYDIVKDIQQSGGILMSVYMLAALYHDSVYNPESKTNEKDSVLLLKRDLKELDLNLSISEESVFSIILDTAKPENSYFNSIDRKVLESNFTGLISYSEKIWKEYSFYDWNNFKTKHLEVIRSMSDNKCFKEYEMYLNAKKPTLAIYAGSFNPFHIGHQDIAEKANRMFDKVVIASGDNPDKDQSSNNFICLRDYVFPFEKVKFSGLLVDLAKHYESLGYRVVLVKGLRDGKDFDYEFAQYRFSEDIYKVNTVYIPCNPLYSHISSKAIRNLKSFDVDVSNYLPRE